MHSPVVQRQPPLVGFCATKPVKDMLPREWLRCKDAGHITLSDTDPVRFTFTGELATPQAVIAWMKGENMTPEVAIKHLRSSHHFTGTAKALEAAVTALINSIRINRRHVCIRPVQIADDDGKRPTTLPSFDAAVAIWGKCCVDVSVKSPTTVSRTAFKTLDHDPDTGATAEEQSLIRAAGASECISVYVAETFQQGGTISKDIGGGAASFGTPGFGEAVITVEGVDPTIVAHEMGHSMNYKPHAPAGTIMEVTANKHDQRESDRVAWVICEKVRTSAKPAGGKEDCTADVS